jgi:hypothetical protein
MREWDTKETCTLIALPTVFGRHNSQKQIKTVSEWRNSILGQNYFFAKAAPTQHRIEKMAAVMVKIADNVRKSNLIPFLTNSVNLIMLVKTQFGIVANTSDQEIRKLMKSRASLFQSSIVH